MPADRGATTARARWEDLWRRLGVPAGSIGTFEELVASYAGDGRHYHTLHHVLDCLALLDRFEHLATHREEIECALWFHDAIYDPRRGDNERASADWACRVLRAAGVEDAAVRRIRRMILATGHGDAPVTSDEALALDIDLSILGRRPEEFEEYQEQIRREFAWVPASVYRSARASVLGAFLDRERIFRTEPLRARYEARARANLATALRELDAEPAAPGD